MSSLLPKPWHRKSKKAWYLQISRTEQKRLGHTKEEADRAYRDWQLEHGQSFTAQDRKKLTIVEIA